MVAKAKHLTDKTNPRFVVSSLSKENWLGQSLYEGLYCTRREMENRIKEQLGLFADRTSAHRMRVNQMRLWLSSLAYVLIARLRRWGLQDTEWERAEGENDEWARAQIWKLRAKLLKIGALVKVSVRRVFLRSRSTTRRRSSSHRCWPICRRPGCRDRSATGRRAGKGSKSAPLHRTGHGDLYPRTPELEAIATGSTR